MANRFSTAIGRRGTAALTAIGLLVAGGAAGGVTIAMTRQAATMAPATPVAIRTLADDGGIVTIRGRVAEVYGSHFILADPSGRALVDAGRDGDGRLAAGQPITVQGRYHDGFVRAAFLVDAAGHVEQVGPPYGPHGLHGDRRGPHGPHGPRGPEAPGGAGDDRNAPPPPPAPATAS